MVLHRHVCPYFEIFVFLFRFLEEILIDGPTPPFLSLFGSLPKLGTCLLRMFIKHQFYVCVDLPVKQLIFELLRTIVT